MFIKNIDELRLLDESIIRIHQSRSNIVNLGSLDRKKITIKVLNLYNITYIEKKGKSHKIIIERYFVKKFEEICNPKIDDFKKKFLKELIDHVNLFFTKNYFPIKKRLIHLYSIMENIESVLISRELNGFLFQIHTKKTKFCLFSNYFKVIVNAIISIYETIKKSNLISRYDLISEWEKNIEEKEYFFSILKELLDKKLILFNILREDLPIENNCILIPKAIQNSLNSFELLLRHTLIRILLEQTITEINIFFPPGKFRNYKQEAKKELRESGKSIEIIENFTSSNFRNENDLRLIFEAMSNNDYINFMVHNHNLLPLDLQTSNYVKDLKKIGKLRNIPAHNKSQAEREISEFTEILYNYFKIFNDFLILLLSMGSK